MKTAYIYEDSLKLRKTWFRRPCPARAYTTIVVPVFTLTTSLELFDLFMLFKLFRLSYLNHLNHYFLWTTWCEILHSSYFNWNMSFELPSTPNLNYFMWAVLYLLHLNLLPMNYFTWADKSFFECLGLILGRIKGRQ